MKGDYELLAVNLRMLKWLCLWPDEDFLTLSFLLKNLIFNSHVYLAGYTVIIAIIRQIVIGVDDSSALVEGSSGSIDFIGYMYTICCFFGNISKIKYAVKTIYDFENFCPKHIMMETEFTVRKYSIAIFSYGFVGNTVNSCLALYGGLTNCRRPNEILYQRDPCGYPCRCFYPIDISGFPLYWIMFFLQSLTCYVISLGILAITMLIVGLLIHTIDQLKRCRKIMAECSLNKQKPRLELEKEVKMIIKYHIAIIKYADQINSAFSTIVLFYITITSLIISILGFNFLIMDNATDFLRYGLHLFGWLVLLYLVCFYGQQLIDESNKIGSSVYLCQWFNASTSIQKDLLLIIIRAQRPLTLTALSLGIMSFEIFLKVIRAAYSYFTLFVNLKYKT